MSNMPYRYAMTTKAPATSVLDSDFHWPIVSDHATIQAVTSGDLVSWNGAAGVALTDYDTVHGEVMVSWAGAYKFPVTAIDGSGNSAVILMDALYYNIALGRIDKIDTGEFVGYALGSVTAGETTTIGIKFVLNKGAA